MAGPIGLEDHPSESLIEAVLMAAVAAIRAPEHFAREIPETRNKP